MSGNEKTLTKLNIPTARPDLRGNEEKYVVQAIRSSWISSSGDFVDRFESEFAQFTGCRRALSVCNGTVALHLALLALDIRPGDEVLVPSLTYIATANCVRYVGAVPVFVDVHPDTWCIDPNELENKITRRTRAIIAVHLYGRPADMDRICAIAAVHGLWVVEDAAEAHGATYKGRRAGSLGHIATFSFYGNKILTCGEGGAITLNDEHLFVRLKSLRGQGMDPSRRYYFPIVGYNYRLTNVACAFLCAQLERFEEIIAARNRIYDLYDQYFSSSSGLRLQGGSEGATIAPWLYPLIVERDQFGIDRDALIAELAVRGIESRPFFIPIHTLPPYREGRPGVSLIHTEELGKKGMNLPTYASMTFDEVETVARNVLQCPNAGQ